MSTEKIVADEGAQLDFSKDMSYGDYLHLDEVLGAQHPRSPEHNEMLFIVQHQTSELWMKLLLHELSAAVQCITRDELGSAFKMLARVSKIMEQLVHAWDVLATMTPPEYSAIRPYLANSSGFQSWQYRCIEFMLGNKNAAMLKPHAHRPEILAQRRGGVARAVALRRGAAAARAARPGDPGRRTWSATGRRRTSPATRSRQAWLVVYRDPQAHWDLYQLGEELTDLEDAFRLWRFRHVTTVERVIGFKRGTGGTCGRRLPAQDARRRAVPGDLEAAHRSVGSGTLARRDPRRQRSAAIVGQETAARPEPDLQALAALGD